MNVSDNVSFAQNRTPDIMNPVCEARAEFIIKGTRTVSDYVSRRTFLSPHRTAAIWAIVDDDPWNATFVRTSELLDGLR